MKHRLFILAQKLLPQHALSALAGKLTTIQSPWLVRWCIHRFIKRYNVDISSAQGSIEDYPTFRDFFIRQLRPDARPLDNAVVISPCDGTIADIGTASDGTILQAKKHPYTLAELTADSQVFTNASHTTIYLAPRDYHRVHMPCDATLTRWRYLPGTLFSVNQVTAEHIPGLYARNERLVCHFSNSQGSFYLIMVGAMLVSGIVSSWHGKHDLAQDSNWQQVAIPMQRFQEIGYFCFGSTVIMLFEPSFGQWNQSLQTNRPILVGQSMISNEAQP